MIAAGGPIQVGRFVDHDRRIARAGHDRPFAAVECRAGHRGTAGDADQRHVAVLEDRCRPTPASARRSRRSGCRCPGRWWIASLKRRTPSAATRLPLGCGLTTSVLPAAIMLTALPVMVGSEWVTGVMAPITPNGACSITASPWSPLNTSLRRNSTPGARSPERLEFLDLVLEPPDLGLVHLHRAQFDATGRWRCVECGR